ncbi:MAG: hypothetical protein ABIJ16_05455, partial [Bacteroidota bacterium]
MSSNKFRYLILLITVLLLSGMLHAQKAEEEKNRIIEELIEDIAGNSDIELDYSTLLDDLNFLYDNPLDLNKAGKE